jgi:hypothetical protein
MIVMGGDMGPHDRKFPHVLRLDCAGIARQIGHAGLALGTDIWIVITHGIEMVRIRRRALVLGVPRLCASSSSARGAGRTRWRAGGIG